jgi:DNA polymerase-4
MSGLVGRIRERLSLEASVGIGPNKLVAKVASDAEKPRGFVVLTREQAVERFASESVRLMPGIGPKTAERLRREGVETLGQLQRCTVPGLIERFGETHGRGLHERAHFRSDSPVSEERETKSRSVESTFDIDIGELSRMEEIVAEQAERLATHLREREVAGRTIGIKVRTDDFATYTRVRSIDRMTNDPETIAGVALQLLRENPPRRPVRLLGVKVAGFESPRARHNESPALSLLSV